VRRGRRGFRGSPWRPCGCRNLPVMRRVPVPVLPRNGLEQAWALGASVAPDRLVAVHSVSDERSPRRVFCRATLSAERLIAFDRWR